MMNEAANIINTLEFVAVLRSIRKPFYKSQHIPTHFLLS
jgi:hypothetical protein